MNKIIFLIFLIASISISPAFAQQVPGQEILIFTDNTAYQKGDIITASGNVKKILPATPVIIQIFFERTQVDIAQIKVAQNGKFSTTFVADGPLWNTDGQATLRVGYGSDITETSFDFFSASDGNDLISNSVVDIPDSGTFDVPYTIKGGTVEFVSLNQNNLGLDVKIDTNSDGYIILQIYREFMDATKNDGSDENFIIIISDSQNENYIQTEYREIESTNAFRIIEIPLKQGDSLVQIVGTFVIPEFATVAQFVLIIAIISIVAITAKTKFRLNNF
mgnify:CR=1 FL=1|tara:strand:- start:1846 stop:2676 length:831 start_codon:yes stop_codon:yes gene_type:complete